MAAENVLTVVVVAAAVVVAAVVVVASSLTYVAVSTTVAEHSFAADLVEVHAAAFED